MVMKGYSAFPKAPALMHCLFFIGYCFTPTYNVFSDNHSVDFLHSQVYLLKYPLFSTTSAGQGDVPVLTLSILLTARCIYPNTCWPIKPAGHGDIPTLTLLILSTAGYVCQ